MAQRPHPTPGDAATAVELEGLVRACEADLGAVAAARVQATALAGTVGGELAFRWALVDLRAAMAAPPPDADDAIRERYGELLDRHRGEPDRLERLRALGDEIRRLEAAGVLPSAMVVRTPRGPHR